MAKARDRAMAAVERIREAEKASSLATTKSEKVEAAIQKIRAFHDLGRSLPASRGHREDYGRGIIKGEAQRLHVNEDILRKARVFAHPDEGYSSTELDDLCRLIREVQEDQDAELAVFERSHVVRLLSVRRKKQRLALQRRCIERGWSTSELEREIAKRFGTRREGGRRRAIPSDLTGLLAQLEGMCEEWRRWKEELARDPEEVIEKHVFLDDLPDTLRQQIRAASKAIWVLHQQVVEELKRLQPDREVRGALQSDTEDQKRPSGHRRRDG